MKIYRYSLFANEETGLKETIQEFECVEKNATYKIAGRPSTFGGKSTMVKKGEILKVDSMVREMVTPISFYTWYLKGQEEEARKLVFNKIRKAAHDNWRKAEIVINLIIGYPPHPL